MRLRRTTLVGFGLLAALFFPCPLAAHTQVGSTEVDQFPPQPEAPVIKVYSREIIVDVSVTDDAGKPVHGLKRSDFTIEENGKPQPLRSFAEFGPGLQPPEPGPRKLPPHVYSNSGAVTVTGPVNVFLMDVMDTAPDTMEIAKRKVLKYLETMPSGTQVAIFSLSSNKGLRLLQGFTSDRIAAIAAMQTLDVEWFRNPPKVDLPYALQKLSAYVSGARGRKNLLWVVPGMPAMLTRDGGYSWGNPDMSKVHRLMDTYEQLTAAEVAVYPVDPNDNFSLGWKNLRAEQVAEDTGGLALYNTNDLVSAIGQAIDHGSSFYTLSYIPPNSRDDGHYHHIRIGTDRPGLHLVYRKGYNAEHPAPSARPQHCR